ncbi:MAG: CRTAC1 family protein, partial [Gammaproteobacteria bacterium]|nr:CRTAC1 family protein [Gammaproteobacteria bacterium]
TPGASPRGIPPLAFGDTTHIPGGPPPAALRAPALGVAAHDFDGDGDTDFYVANDGAANHLWLNQGDGTFRDGAELAFAAFNANGAPEAGMGVDAEDYDGDCDPDLFVTHLATETNTLYVNHGGWFSDSTAGAGLAASSGPYTGFGAGWIDADNDGDLDLFSANGAVFPMERQRLAGDPYPLRQRNQLWINDGTGVYREFTSAGALDAEEVSRGAAFADLDNDGDTDIIVSNNSGPPRLYRNDAATAPWIGLELPQGTTATLAGETCPLRRASTDGSYASANDPRLLFRLPQDEPRRVHLRWPDGRKTTTAPLRPNRYHRPNAKD